MSNSTTNGISNERLAQIEGMAQRCGYDVVMEVTREVRRLRAERDGLRQACEAILPYLSTQSQLLDYAATNDGQASGYDIASMKIRAALAPAPGTGRGGAGGEP